MNHQFDYKAVLFLNNLAISMTERACYKQAYATLRNASDVYKILVIRHNDEQQQHKACKVINDTLNRSLERMCNPVQSARRMPLHVVSHDHQAEGLNTSNVMIRINDTEHYDLLDDDSKVPLLPLVIVFYNLAVLGASLAIDNVKIRDSSNKFLGLSFQLACNCFIASSDPFVRYRAVNIATIVLQTLPEGKDVDVLFCHLTHIRTVANRFENSRLFYSLTNSAAAAAAATA
jgi:hypothetical protein